MFIYFIRFKLCIHAIAYSTKYSCFLKCANTYLQEILHVYLDYLIKLLFATQAFKVPITSMGILNICNRWILLRKIAVYLVGRKCHLHGLFCC